jgi:hypothetical protein
MFVSALLRSTSQKWGVGVRKKKLRGEDGKGLYTLISTLTSRLSIYLDFSDANRQNSTALSIYNMCTPVL